jgi:hypothetical protein
VPVQGCTLPDCAKLVGDTFLEQLGTVGTVSDTLLAKLVGDIFLEQLGTVGTVSDTVLATLRLQTLQH